MNKNEPKNILEIDVHIRFRGQLYNLSLTKMLKWLLPVLAILLKLYFGHSDEGSGRAF